MGGGSKLRVSIACLFFLFSSSNAFQKGYVMGVPPDFQKLYVADDNGKWICRDNSEVLDFSQVNDDYCDCSDSSDEPGTSACSKGVFFCNNIGDEPKLITSSRVGDGVCDCCSGEDERETTKCEDTCAQQHRDKLEAEKESNERLERALLLKKRFATDNSKKYTSSEKKKDKLAVTRLEKEVKQHKSIIAAAQSGRGDIQAAYQAMDKLGVAEGELREATQRMNADFGPRKEYFHLFSQCFTVTKDEKQYRGGTSNESGVPDIYTFEFCPFRYVSQTKVVKKGKKGSKFEPADPNAPPTILGYFDDWVDGKKYQVYNGGDPCWGGPDRTVIIEWRCSDRTEIVSVGENGKCIYSILFSSSVACNKKSDPLEKDSVALAMWRIRHSIASDDGVAPTAEEGGGVAESDQKRGDGASTATTTTPPEVAEEDHDEL